MGLELWCLMPLSIISWRSVLLVEETRVPRKNHWSVASHRQTWSHNVISSTHHERESNSQNEGELWPSLSGRHLASIFSCLSLVFNFLIFSSEITGPVWTKLDRNWCWVVSILNYIQKVWTPIKMVTVTFIVTYYYLENWIFISDLFVGAEDKHW